MSIKSILNLLVLLVVYLSYSSQIAFATPTPTPIQQVNGTGGSCTPTTVVLPVITPAAGDTLFVTSETSQTNGAAFVQPLTKVTDNQNNPWQVAKTFSENTHTEVDIYFALNVVNTATTVTVHYGQGTTTPCAQNVVLSEGPPVAQIDPTGGTATNGSNTNTPTFLTGTTSTTTSSNLWIIGAVASTKSNSISSGPNNAFTEFTDPGPWGFQALLNPSATGTYSTGWTAAVSSSYSAAIVVFDLGTPIPTPTPTAPTPTPTSTPTPTFIFVTPTPVPTASCTAPNTLVSGSDSSLLNGITGNTTLTGPPFIDNGTLYSVCATGSPGCSNSLPATSNLWNLIPDFSGLNNGAGSPTGSGTLTYTGSGNITTNVSFTGVGASNVIGYPATQYGIGEGVAAEGQPIQFPVVLNSIDSMWLFNNYTVNTLDTGANHSKLWDEFLQPTSTFGDTHQVEVAIFWYYNFNQAPLGATYLGTYVASAFVNGVFQNVLFQEFAIAPIGSTVATVWFVPASTSVPTGTLTAGTGYGSALANIRLDILPLLNAAMTACGTICNSISPNSWYFEGPITGAQFGGTTSPSFTATDSNLVMQMCKLSTFPTPTPTPSPTPTLTPTPTGSPTPTLTPTPTPSSGPTPALFDFVPHDSTGPFTNLNYIVPNLFWPAWASNIEATEGSFSYTNMDAAIAAVHARGSKLQLSFTWGIHAPTWLASDGVPMMTSCTGEQVPVPWDPTYLTKVQTFISNVATHLNGDSSIDTVYLTGMQYQFQASRFPVNTSSGCNDNTTWEGLGYLQCLAEGNCGSSPTGFFLPELAFQDANFPRTVVDMTPLGGFPSGWDSIPSASQEPLNINTLAGQNNPSVHDILADSAGPHGFPPNPLAAKVAFPQLSTGYQSASAEPGVCNTDCTCDHSVNGTACVNGYIQNMIFNDPTVRFIQVYDADVPNVTQVNPTPTATPTPGVVTSGWQGSGLW